MVMQSWADGRYLLKKERTAPVFQGKQLRVVVASDKIQAFYQRETLEKHLSDIKSSVSQILEDFSDEISDVLDIVS